MRRPLFLLSLIAALSATPMRLAEAAHDFARAVAELSGGAGIEVPDGGVGDDSGATIRAANTHAPDLAAQADPSQGTVSPAHTPPCRPLKRAAAVALLSPASLPRRLAWLQRFLC